MVAVDASVEDERLGDVLRVSPRSALSRRRAWADYAASAARYPAKEGVVLLLILLALLVAAAAVRRSSPQPHPPQNVALPLAEPTRAHAYERFHLVHRVVEGDSLWAIAIRYYGSSAPGHMKRLRKANPWHQDDRKLMLDSEVKIPLP